MEAPKSRMHDRFSELHLEFQTVPLPHSLYVTFRMKTVVGDVFNHFDQLNPVTARIFSALLNYSGTDIMYSASR